MNGKLFYRYFIFSMTLVLLLSGLFSCYPNKEGSTFDPGKIITRASKANDNMSLKLGSQMIYMKYFNLSSSYSISYDTVKVDMAGKGIKEVEKLLEGWDILYVDDSKVILEKTINSYGPQTYEICTITENEDEYVCVYEYDDTGEKVLHSVFDTPVMLFDEETVSTLRDGIIVIGNDSLQKALQDFGE